jgi:hypothetical protein
MQTSLFWVAAAVAAITFYVHTFIGGVRVAGPLLADESLPRATKWLAYYCWHLVTMMIAAMTLFFAAAASFGIASSMVLAFSLFCISCSALSAIVAIKGSIAPLRFPSTTLFAVMGLAGTAGALI